MESTGFLSDTIYACQDKRDDVKIGIKSTALLFGDNIKPILTTFASALIVSLWVAGQMNNMGIYYKLISVGGGALYLATDMLTVDLDSPKSCWASVWLFFITARTDVQVCTVSSKWVPIRWPRVGWHSGRLPCFCVILSMSSPAVCYNVCDSGSVNDSEYNTVFLPSFKTQCTTRRMVMNILLMLRVFCTCNYWYCHAQRWASTFNTNLKYYSDLVDISFHFNSRSLGKLSENVATNYLTVSTQCRRSTKRKTSYLQPSNNPLCLSLMEIQRVK
jgi:hypothetical protein